MGLLLGVGFSSSFKEIGESGGVWIIMVGSLEVYEVRVTFGDENGVDVPTGVSSISSLSPARPFLALMMITMVTDAMTMTPMIMVMMMMIVVGVTETKTNIYFVTQFQL